MIAKQLQQLLSQPDERVEILPRLVGLHTIQHVNHVRSEILARVQSLSDDAREFRRALARLGFAGTADLPGE